MTGAGTKNVTITLGFDPRHDSLLWSWVNDRPDLNFDDSFDGSYRVFLASIHAKVSQGVMYSVWVDGEIAGAISFIPDIAAYSFKTAGMVIAPKYQRQGVGEIGMKLCMSDLLRLVELPMRVSAVVFEHNVGIKRVLMKCGFEYEGSHIDAVMQNGKPINTLSFAIVMRSPQLMIGEDI